MYHTNKDAPIVQDSAEQHSYWANGLLRYCSTALVMLALLALGFVIKHHAFAFDDIGGDTFVQFFPLQMATVHQLEELHTLTWSFELGLGGYLGASIDPFWLMSAIFPDDWQLQSRLPVYLFKLLLGGGFFYGYLRMLGFRATLGVFGGLAYAFSSVAIINGQWDPHGNELIQFAAYLFLFEKSLRYNTSWAAVLAGVFVGAGATFGIYTFALLTCVYAMVRFCFVGAGARKIYLIGLARFGVFCVLGLLLTAPLQLPGLYYLFDSPRVSGGSALSGLLESLFTFNDRVTISSEIIGLLGKDLLGSGNAYHGWANYFEGPGFYIGLLPLLCIPQLIAPGTTRNERRLFFIGIGMTALYMLFPAVRHAVYGFGHIAFRFSTVWVSAALLTLGLAGLRRTLQTGPWWPGLLVGTLGILGIVMAGVILLPETIRIEQVVRVVAFTLVYAAILFTAVDSAWRARLSTPLVMVFACELLLFSLPAMYDRSSVHSDGISVGGRYDDGTEQALAFLREQEPSREFYRIEKTYHSIFLCDALVQRYSGIKSYFFHGNSMSRFFAHVSEPSEASNVSYIKSFADRPMILDLLAVKYVLTHDRNLEKFPAMSYLGTAGGVDVYRNDAAHDFGYFYDNLADEVDADNLSLEQRDALLLESVIVPDATAIKAQLGQIGGANAAHFELAQGAKLIKLRDDQIEGEIQTPQAKVLLLSMPFDRGWSARLNDKPLELFRADYGLTAALIPAGKHALALSYVPPGRRFGWWLSFLSLGLLVAWQLLQRQLARRVSTLAEATK